MVYPLHRIFQNQIGCKAGVEKIYRQEEEEKNINVLASIHESQEKERGGEGGVVERPACIVIIERTKLIIRSQDPKQFSSVPEDD